jgi:peptide deformylase
MALLRIVKFGNPILKQVARAVPAVTPELVRLTDDMLETMHQASGVGLAANQVGLPDAIAVIGYRETVLRMFNPRIVSRKGHQCYGEGCLSLPGVDGDVKRAAEVTAVYTDESGYPVERTFTGHLARVVQHEVDHLNGILLVAHLSVAARTLHRKTLDRLRQESAPHARASSR